MAIDFHKWRREAIATIHEPDADDCAHATSFLNRAVLTQLGVARHAVSPPLHYLELFALVGKQPSQSQAATSVLTQTGSPLVQLADVNLFLAKFGQ